MEGHVVAFGSQCAASQHLGFLWLLFSGHRKFSFYQCDRNLNLQLSKLELFHSKFALQWSRPRDAHILVFYFLHACKDNIHWLIAFFCKGMLIFFHLESTWILVFFNIPPKLTSSIYFPSCTYYYFIGIRENRFIYQNLEPHIWIIHFLVPQCGYVSSQQRKATTVGFYFYFLASNDLSPLHRYWLSSLSLCV